MIVYIVAVVSNMNSTTHDLSMLGCDGAGAMNCKRVRVRHGGYFTVREPVNIQSW